MTLPAGNRIGPYEILASLGAGGMGEVYRARDARLGRDVAIKILPAVFASDPERLSRFEREARTLASLNHPHIAQIYGVEANALVMELVEGEDLSARLARGPMPLADALPMAMQIADALEAAHERGIIHRDLKPANIKIAADGSVKVLDFGLAKAAEADASAVDLRNSPTMAMSGTIGGMILGTAAYMAPEQARAQPVDRRADIWAFGVVLFEMLSGTRAFSGETISDVLASVLKNDLDWTALPADLPAPILSLLKRCLHPDRRQRLRDVGEARIAIAEFLAAPPAAAAPAASAPPLRWQIATAATALVAVAAIAFPMLRAPAAPGESLRYTIPPPGAVGLHLVDRPSVSISPDGRSVIFVGAERAATQLYLRTEEDFDARLMAGTDNATDPAFSPDSRTIAFVAGERLKTITLEGVVASLAPVNDPRGVAWLDAATIVYSPESIGGLFIVPVNGGAPRALTTLDEKGGERTHRWPHALPGDWVLFTVGLSGSPDHYDDSRIEAVHRTSGERRVVYQGAAMARYAQSGHLVFARGDALFAVRFDPATLAMTGTPVNVMQGLGRDATTGAAHVAWSTDGTLAYVPGDARGGLRQIVWADRAGTFQALPQMDPALYSDLRLSPDATRMAVVVGTGTQSDIWVYTFGRGTMTRLTFGGLNASPVWSSDGREVYFSSIAPNGRDTVISKTRADGGREPVRVMSVTTRAYMKHVSADASWTLIDYVINGGPASNVGRLELRQGAEVEPLVATQADDYGAMLSPDGRFIAYHTNETGRAEVYVRELSAGGGRWQISSNGGEEPKWSGDGRRLFFRTGSELLVVDVETASAFRSGNPTRLFDSIYNLRSDTGVSYDPHPDGTRFLMLRQAENPSKGTVRVMTHWFDELRRKVR